jgi:YYY domain-containing protein
MRIGIVTMHSPLLAFLLVQAVWMLPASLYVMLQTIRTNRARSAIATSLLAAILIWFLSGSPTVALLIALVILSWRALLRTHHEPLMFIAPAFALLLAAEVFYVDDIYGAGLLRMNIVFKFHLHAILLLAVASGASLQVVFKAMPRGTLRYSVGLLVAAVLLAVAVYPAGAIISAFASSARSTLDGTAYMRRDTPGDLAAIEYLNTRAAGQPVIAEATDAPYSFAARISANTGLPTILGWANHEIVWRRSDAARAEIGRRTEDVRSLYEGDVAQAAVIARKYRVRFVVVGEFERKTYPAGNFRKFETMGRKVFEGDGTALFELNEETTAR